MTVGQGSAPNAQVAQFRSDGFTSLTGLRLPFFTDSFSRSFGFPDVRPLNLISEETPLREERPFAAYVGLREVHYSRPGLIAGFNLGAGPIRGVFRAPNIYGGGLFLVSGTSAYNASTGASCGTIPGADRVRWAASEAQMVLIANGAAWLYDGASFGQIVNASLPPVCDVAYCAGRFAYMATGTDKWWYSEIDDAANETGLDFATAESSPDPNIAVAMLNDELMILGTQSVEFWSPGSDPTAPFTPVVGRGYQRGCIARDAVQYADNSIFWVGDDGSVYRAGNSSPTKISSASIDDKIRQCATPAAMSALSVSFEGHPIYLLNIPGVGSYAYDISRVGTQAQAYGDSYQRGEWQQWSSWQHTTFRGQCAAMIGPAVWIGDDTTNDLWSMQVGVFAEGSNPLIRQASAFIKVEEGSPRCLNLILHGVVGQGLGLTGSATAEMRYSDDQGRTFTSWRAASLGKQGQYEARAVWQRLGSMRAPGRLVQVRISDAVDVALSHLELNSARPAS
ncbi:MAG TPA: packaged DNA stabilization protein [Caulobacteraceae bacterium]|jgi:hypothetical protein|nr:packaged DNA stabilization protein [Caulobacteraceae bacterium]